MKCGFKSFYVFMIIATKNNNMSFSSSNHKFSSQQVRKMSEYHYLGSITHLDLTFEVAYILDNATHRYTCAILLDQKLEPSDHRLGELLAMSLQNVFELESITQLLKQNSFSDPLSINSLASDLKQPKFIKCLTTLHASSFETIKDISEKLPGPNCYRSLRTFPTSYDNPSTYEDLKSEFINGAMDEYIFLFTKTEKPVNLLLITLQVA
uniref:Diguanylate cyclase-like protein n=1 Tax=Navicula ramosissima TaxID=265559 RepID=A0A343A6X9_9STRA|nr:diguanylate cyclase-like protein [Navicula ramosissima]AOY40417.1 diguanylate cyclase-like protein [Navicula ramosissima]